MPYNHEEPTSVDEAYSRRNALTDKLGVIQQQLGDRNRTHPDGRRMTPQEYYAWRKQAVGALNATMSELRFLKDYIRRAESGTWRILGDMCKPTA